jgi:hypothetical protein
MTNTFPNTTINTLPEFTMIAGSDQDLFFNIYDSGSALVDLTGSTFTWLLAPYGQPTSVLTKTGTYSGSPVGQIKVALVSADTVSLANKYTQQYKLLDIGGKVFRAQGLVLLTPAVV